jgi:hypothetical protein
LITVFIIAIIIFFAIIKGYSIELWPTKIIASNRPKMDNRVDGFIFIERQDVDKIIGSIEERFANAKHEILISGNDNKYIAESCSALVDEALSRGVRVKILCTDPNSEAASMLPIIDPRYENAEDFKISMTPVIRELNKKKEKYPNLFEYRLLQFMPAISFFIVDPLLPSGIVKSEIYTAKPYNSRPHFILPIDSKWRLFFVNQWNNYWNSAKTTD